MANESWPYRVGRGIREFPGDAMEADRIVKEMALGAGLGAYDSAVGASTDFFSGMMGQPQARTPRAPAPAPRVPQPRQPSTALDFDSRIRELDDMDRREQEYLKSPEAFEQKRMAAPPTSGELRYSIGGGPERSYNVGMNRADVTGDQDFKRYHDDMVFGQKRAPAPAGGRKGTVSMMTALNDPMDDPNYRNYLANAGPGVLAGAMREQADLSRSSMLAKDPMAVERFSIDKAIAMQDAQARSAYDRERNRQMAEQDSRASVLMELTDAEQHAESERQKLRRTPQYMNAPMETKAQMESMIDNWLAGERARLGIPNDAQWNRVG